MAKIRFNLALALAVLVVGIYGCGPVFFPMSPEKVTAYIESSFSIKKGETTRNQVHELLGAPWINSRLWQVDVFHFSEKKLTPGIVFALIPAFPTVEKVHWDGYVLVTYDDNNRVSAFDSGKFPEPYRDKLLIQANDMTLRYIYNKTYAELKTYAEVKIGELALLTGGRRLTAGLNLLHKANTCTLVVACDQEYGCPDRFSVEDESATKVDINPRWVLRIVSHLGGISAPALYPIILPAGKKRLTVSNDGLRDKSETILDCSDEDVRYAIIHRKAPLHITENMPEDLLSYNIIIWRRGEPVLGE